MALTKPWLQRWGWTSSSLTTSRVIQVVAHGTWNWGPGSELIRWWKLESQKDTWCRTHGCVVNQCHTQVDVEGQKPRSWGKCIRHDFVVVIANNTSDIEPTGKLSKNGNFLGRPRMEIASGIENIFRFSLILISLDVCVSVCVCVSACVSFYVFLFLFFIYILFSAVNRTLLQWVCACTRV